MEQKTEDEIIEERLLKIIEDAKKYNVKLDEYSLAAVFELEQNIENCNSFIILLKRGLIKAVNNRKDNQIPENLQDFKFMPMGKKLNSISIPVCPFCKKTTNVEAVNVDEKLFTCLECFKTFRGIGNGTK